MRYYQKFLAIIIIRVMIINLSAFAYGASEDMNIQSMMIMNFKNSSEIPGYGEHPTKLFHHIRRCNTAYCSD